MKQLQLIPRKKYARRKTARAISLRGMNHVVLKARKPVLRRQMRTVRFLIRETQDRFHIRLRALAVMEDHVHLVLKVSHRHQFANALRFLAGQLALRVAGGRLWRARLWSRPVVAWRDLETVSSYVAANSRKAGFFTQADAYYILDGILQL